MEKYYFKQRDGIALEKCFVANDGTKIGSVKCQRCKHCIFKDEAFIRKWIVCSKIDQAINKDKNN